MTKLILVRHGEPDFSYVTERGFKGHGIVMRQFQYIDEVPHCGIIEVDFQENYKWCGWVERNT